MTRISAILATAAALVGLGLGAYFTIGRNPADPFADCRTSVVAGGPEQFGGAFTLTDQTGQRVTDQQVFDQLSLLYFGYTYCPDVCPLDTTRNAEAADLLAARGIGIRPVMITIDPARDTPQVLAEFVGYLHDDMIGLTGSAEEISAVTRAYRAYAARNGEGEDYLMDHSTFTYLIAPGGQFLEFFSRDLTPEQLAERTACFAERL